MCEYFEGLGVTERELEPGTVVMVPVGRLVAHINGNPVVIAWATVRGPAIEGEAISPDATYWLDVYSIPGGPPVPQMYRAGEIVGVPGLGLSMDGAPERVLSPDPT
jgi:hypothetical protein